MTDERAALEARFLTRRELLRRCGTGFGALALAPLAAAAGEDEPGTLAARTPAFAPRARRVIHLFMNGGPSQVDTFDPKPLLKKYDGQFLPKEVHLKTENTTGRALPSPFAFARHGKSGIEVAEIFPRVARCVDDLCVVRTMKTDSPNHALSLQMMNTGDARLPRPSLGAWVMYGLGSENRNLPGYVSLCPNGTPYHASQNWQSAFLPGIFQGTPIDTRHTEVDKLIENVRNRHTTPERQRRQLDLVAELNRRYQERRREDGQLEARIQSFEMAYRMQIEATDAFDLGREPESVRKLYGDDVQGRQYLIARRLLERGVRFVQLWHGSGLPWDAHTENEKNHRKLAVESDRAIAALLTDLKQRGMLEDTLVLWGGEFGRTPAIDVAGGGKAQNGRDHNHHGFTVWLAGGGVKAGYVHGATDDFGYGIVRDPVHVHDLHATILHLMGFDHERLTYRFAGRDFRLTDVHGEVVKGILA